MQMIRLKSAHRRDILSALPAVTKHGDTFVLVGDPMVPGIDHCAIVAVVQAQDAGRILLGEKKHAVKTGIEIDALVFLLADLARRVETLEKTAPPIGRSEAPTIDKVDGRG